MSGPSALTEGHRFALLWPLPAPLKAAAQAHDQPPSPSVCLDFSIAEVASVPPSLVSQRSLCQVPQLFGIPYIMYPVPFPWGLNRITPGEGRHADPFSL